MWGSTILCSFDHKKWRSFSKSLKQLPNRLKNYIFYAKITLTCPAGHCYSRARLGCPTCPWTRIYTAILSFPLCFCTEWILFLSESLPYLKQQKLLPKARLQTSLGLCKPACGMGIPRWHPWKGDLQALYGGSLRATALNQHVEALVEASRVSGCV